MKLGLFQTIFKQLGIINSRLYSPGVVCRLRQYHRIFSTNLHRKTFREIGDGTITPPHCSGCKYITIGKHTVFGRDVSIVVDSTKRHNQSQLVVIGNGVSIGDYSIIKATSEVIIMDNVLTGRNVLIGDSQFANWDYYSYSDKKAYKSIVIGEDVWIGENAIILPGVNIGKGSVVGAGAMVCYDIPSYSLAAGNPAKILKQINAFI